MKWKLKMNLFISSGHSQMATLTIWNGMEVDLMQYILANTANYETNAKHLRTRWRHLYFPSFFFLQQIGGDLNLCC